MTNRPLDKVRRPRPSRCFKLVAAAVLTSTLMSASVLAEGSSRPQAAFERQWAERHLKEAVVSAFGRFASKDNPKYETWKSYRAGAACIDWTTFSPGPKVRAWGGAWEHDSAAEAIRYAVASCQRAQKDFSVDDCSCELIHDGDTVVYKPPPKAIAAQIASLRKSVIPTLCSNWFGTGKLMQISPKADRSGKRCSGHSIQEKNFELVINRVLRDAQSPTSPDIFPAPPVVRKSEIEERRLTDKTDGTPINPTIIFYPPVGDEGFNTKFRLPSGLEYRFDIYRVPTDRQKLVLAALLKLERSKMYERFKQTWRPRKEKMNLPYFNPSDEFALYARAYDLSDSEVRSAFSLAPEESRDGLLYGERSTRLWVESAIPVDADWIPVGQPKRAVVPIAIQTDRSLYLYRVKSVRSDGGGGLCRSLRRSGT